MPAQLPLDLRREPRAPVDHRQQDPRDREPRVEPRLDEVDRAEQLREALERVVLGLHRHEHAVGGGERVDGQRAERRRAVEEDERVRVGRRGASASARYRSPPSSADSCDGRGGELRLRRHEVEVRERGRLRELARAGRRRAGRASRCRSRARRAPRSRSPAGRGRRARHRSPASARQAARLTAVVVLPTPPFWFASA